MLIIHWGWQAGPLCLRPISRRMGQEPNIRRVEDSEAKSGIYGMLYSLWSCPNLPPLSDYMADPLKPDDVTELQDQLFRFCRDLLSETYPFSHRLERGYPLYSVNTSPSPSPSLSFIGKIWWRHFCYYKLAFEVPFAKRFPSSRELSCFWDGLFEESAFSNRFFNTLNLQKTWDGILDLKKILS